MTTLRMIPGITYTRKNLEALTGMPDRENRRMIRAQRRQGVPIVALPDGGYKLAETDEEKKMLLAMYRKRALDELDTYRRLAKSMQVDLKEAGVALWRLWCYVLVQDVEESKRRILALWEMGVEPFAQPYRDYNGGEPTAEQKRLARWVNNKAAFNSCTFADFEGGRK